MPSPPRHVRRTDDGRSRVLAALVAALALSLAPRIAHAQHSRFDRLVQQASEAYGRGDGDAAIHALERAYAMRPVPLLLFNIGRAYDLAGRPASAIEYYDRFLATNPDPGEAETARQARAASQAAIEAREHPQPPPDTHAHPDHTPPPPPVEQPVTVIEHGPRRFTGLHAGLLIGGGVLAAAGGVFGGLALASSADFSTAYTNGQNDGAVLAGMQDRGTAFAWAANVGIAVGAAAVITGLILYLTQDTSRVVHRMPSHAAAGGAR